MKTKARNTHRTSAGHYAGLDAMHQILQNHLTHKLPPPELQI